MMGNRLREVLNKEGVSGYRLQKELGVDKGQLSRFLNGKIDMSLKKLEQIADYLGYDLVLVKRSKPSEKGGNDGNHLQAKKFKKLVD
jgi:transcriptional regulator with XRE-family HTH domain